MSTREKEDQRTDAEKAAEELEEARRADTEEEEPADDETVQQWLTEVLKTPEIKSVVREAARQAASSASDRTERDVRKDIEDDLGKRLERIESQLHSGKITEEQATERARRAAEDAGDKVQPNEDEARKASEREARLHLRELEQYRRERLNEEDKTTLVEKMVVVQPGMTEDDIDDMIEASKKVYSTIRKSIVQDLRSKGWKAPRDLERETTRRTVTTTRTPAGESEDSGPPTRDRQGTKGLTRGRKSELRSRFNYADQGRGSQPRR